MSIHTYDAIRCFTENTQIIDTHQNPTEWNLNNGLQNLAKAIQEIENKLDRLQQAVEAAK